jgi:hypothetical protein
MTAGVRKLIVAQLVKIFPACYGSRSFRMFLAYHIIPLYKFNEAMHIKATCLLLV